MAKPHYKAIKGRPANGVKSKAGQSVRFIRRKIVTAEMHNFGY